MTRFALTDFEWSVIEPLLPVNTRGLPRGNDRRVLNGILWRLRTGASWADIPARYGPHTTCVNRFIRWRRTGVWDRIVAEINKAYSGDLRLIDASAIDGLQMTGARNGDKPDPVAWVPPGRHAGTSTPPGS